MLPVVVLLLLAGERTAYTSAERLLDDSLSSWHEALDPTPAQQYILAQPSASTDRVLAFGEDANRMGANGLLQADGYQTIYPGAYQQLLAR